MSADTLFSVASSAVVPGWALLVVAPRWRWTARVIGSVLLPLLLGTLYVFLVATAWGSAPEGGFGSLTAVRRLFDEPRLLLAGWVHYLAFDLFVGSWEVRDSQRLRIPHLVVVPCLVATFLFGPAGLLLYFALRWSLRRKLAVEEERPEGSRVG